MSCPKCGPAPTGRARSSPAPFPDADPDHPHHHPHLGLLGRKTATDDLGSAAPRPLATATLTAGDPAGRTGAPTVLLVGNPNVGKSTLFNAVTGSRQAVVNAPGTTVECMEGRWASLGARVLDLPGTYSLIATSPDEQVVVDTLTGASGSLTDPARGGGVDLVVVVLDATALTRSLYLLGQVARTGRPVLAVVTLADVAAHEGVPVDVRALTGALGVPVVAVDPRTREGVGGLDAAVRAALDARPHVAGIRPATAGADTAAGRDPMEEAEDVFTWVEGVEAAALGGRGGGASVSRSDRIDRLLLHPLVGVPVFFALMWLLLKVAGEWVGPVQDLFDALFSSTRPGAPSVANLLSAGLTALGWQDTWVSGLLIGGVCAGLGVVASFLPLMFTIFLMISVLEDSGYMARAAFLGDRVMRAIGLDGRVIMPLIMGFGCNLPALAATRTLKDARQRLVTTLVVPYTSCAARLTIYLMVARIFFPTSTGTVVFALYVLSMAMVVLGALVLRPWLNRGSSSAPLMLVLPPYQVPRPVATVRRAALRAWSFVTGAGRIIVVMTLVVWVMGAVPMAAGHSFADPDLPMEDSLYGRTAQALVPVLAPTGFGEWHMAGALMTGFVAKETVISSIVTSYNMDPATAGGDAEAGGSDLGSLPELVRGSFESSAGDSAAVAAFAFLVFVLTYTPCLATVAEQVRQVGGRMAAGAVGVQLVTAWVLATAVFQVGRLLL